MADAAFPRHGDNPGGSVPLHGGSAGAELVRFRRYRGDHVARLRFSFELGARGRVLDYGCGPAMAAFLAPSSLSAYVGVELDEAPRVWARRYVGQLPFPAEVLTPAEFSTRSGDDRYDLVLLLEVIEHVREPAVLLREALARVAPGGRLVVSTPNGALSRNDPRLYQSSYHLVEFDPVEFSGLVRSIDPRAEIFEQHRRDRADVLPQLVQRFLLPSRDADGGGRHEAAPGRKDPNPLFRMWERLPQPAALWTIRRYATPRRTDQGFSHLIAVLRNGSG